MKNNIETINEVIFENIKHIDDEGNEFWYARELQYVLGYNQWRSINDLIKRAKLTCKESKYNIDDHFALDRKMVSIGSKTTRNVLDYKLTRYACYLIVMNGNPQKPCIALGQTYFAVQTRKQELSELKKISEDEKRLDSRNRIRKSNNQLGKVALKSGVRNFDKFHNYGYKGLYNGETANDIAKRKNLRYKEEILDNMCSGELIANEFRINLTKEALENKNINNEHDANIEHFNIGKSVRNVIKENGGTLPENYATPNKCIKELNKRNKLKK